MQKPNENNIVYNPYETDCSSLLLGPFQSGPQMPLGIESMLTSCLSNSLIVTCHPHPGYEDSILCKLFANLSASKSPDITYMCSACPAWSRSKKYLTSSSKINLSEACASAITRL